jgi:6-phosphofructokinase 1
VNKGGTVLKSARSLEFRTPEGRLKAYENLESRD